MADNGFKINKSLNLNPQPGSPSNPLNGDVYYDGSVGSFIMRTSGSWSNMTSFGIVSTAANLTSAQFTPSIVQNSIVKLTGSTPGNVCGMTSSFSAKQVILYNASSALQVIKYQSLTEPTSNNRIITPTAGDMNLTAGDMAVFIYDATQTSWVLISISSLAGSQIVATTTNTGLVKLHATATTPSSPIVISDGDLDAANGVVGLDANRAATITANGGNANALTATGNGIGVGVKGLGGVNNTSTGTNGENGSGLYGVGASGTFGGRGVTGIGSPTRSGVHGIGGSSNGVGVIGEGGATTGMGGMFTGGSSGIGVQGTGGGIQTGVVGIGGASGGVGVIGNGTLTGIGGIFNAGASGADGVQANGVGSGAGGTFFAGGSGIGVVGQGAGGVSALPGAAAGAGGAFVSNASNNNGLFGQGTNAGYGVYGLGGSSGGGVNGQGVASGIGVTGTGGASSGTGVLGTGGGPAGWGVVGNGIGSGIGVVGAGGASDGVGGRFTGGGNGVGVAGAGSGGSPLINLNATNGQVGVSGIGGTGGDGVVGYGNGSSRTGVYGKGGTNGTGVIGLGNGTGVGLSASPGVASTSSVPTNAITASQGNINFSGTANPNSDVGFTNTLTPMNIPKAWGRITCGASPSMQYGFNVSSSLTYSGSSVIITLAQAMANSNYIVICTSYGTGDILQVNITNSSQFLIAAYDNTGVLINLSSSAQQIMFLVFGNQ